MRISFFLLLAFSLSWSLDAQSLSVSDLTHLVGDDWKGELTYRNYSDGQMISIPTELVVLPAVKRTYPLRFIYPDEPQANSTGKFRIGKGGKVIGKSKIISIDRSDSGELTVVAQGRGKDDGKKAEFRFTYTLSATKYTSQKEVKYTDTAEYIVRNKAVFTR